EVELRDYINVLLKWKKLIIGITILAMLVAGVMSYFVIKPVYQGCTNVVLPLVAGEQILSAEGVKTLIESDSFAKALSEKTGIPYDEVSDKINASIIQKTDIVEITFEDNDMENMAKFFDALIPLLNEQYKELYDNKTDVIKAGLLILEGQLDLLREQEQVIFDRIEQIKEDGRVQAEYALEYSLLLSTYNSITETKMSAEQQVADLKSQLKMSHNFTYLNSPVISDTPIKPKKLFNIAVSGVAAFFFAILLAFFLEYWYGTKEKQERKKPA
ncbi:MAG: Wzz/FepE/Etk N-terminal domain-containing protein, partial [Caldisericota bacterium]|nr:Wzz/FepE/Etk N-terminal domain-containing protein [Caldisericota bacterium]